MPNIHIETDQLIDAALQLTPEEFDQFVTKLFSIKARERAPVLSEREAELLQNIYQGLTAETRQRMDELIKNLSN